ncbi:hypothetical protein [Dokdonella sp.]|uniref:hypothetical protein n=1 Tax=Dokdonella sp. TaxID=2291710 RepID=UPI002DD654F7|nr:hypothetical protein [Dokdonella sp.]
MLDAQLQTLAAAIRAETNQACVDALAIRNDVAMEQWINADSAQSAWNPAMTGIDMFEVTDVTKFDGLVAGKREAWRLMLDFAPINFGRQKFRKAVTDVWGTTDSKAVLTACTRPATNGEKYLGGTTATENTISALKLSFPGNIPISEISNALNRF